MKFNAFPIGGFDDLPVIANTGALASGGVQLEMNVSVGWLGVTGPPFFPQQFLGYTADCSSTMQIKDASNAVILTWTCTFTMTVYDTGATTGTPPFSSPIYACSVSGRTDSVTPSVSSLPNGNSDSLSADPAYAFQGIGFPLINAGTFAEGNVALYSPAFIFVVPAGAYRHGGFTATATGFRVISAQAGNYNARPAANPTALFTTSVNADDVSFDASASTISDGVGNSDAGYLPLAYSWVYGDGLTGTGVNPHHVFQYSDTFPVALIATDQYGGKGTVAHSLKLYSFPANLLMEDESGTYFYFHMLSNGVVACARTLPRQSYTTAGEISVQGPCLCLFAFQHSGVLYEADTFDGSPITLRINSSSDHGQTWGGGTVVASSVTLLGIAFEPESGNAYALCKTLGGVTQYLRTNMDNAGAWATATPANTTGLPNNLRLAPCFLADGEIFTLAYDAAAVTLTIYNSTDSGATWTSQLVLSIGTRYLSHYFSPHEGLYVMVQDSNGANFYIRAHLNNSDGTWALDSTTPAAVFGIPTSQNWVPLAAYDGQIDTFLKAGTALTLMNSTDGATYS